MDRMAIFGRRAVETLEYFSKELAGAFERFGYEIFWLDFEMLGLSVWKLGQAVRGKEAVFVTFNFIGLSGEEQLWDFDDDGMPNDSFWDKQGIRCLNIMVDHPIYYYKALQHPPADMQTFCIDREHTAYMKRFYADIPCAFLPIAGNGPLISDIEPFAQWEARPYQVVFTANYVRADSIEKQLDHLEPEYRDFYYEIIEALIQHPEKGLLETAEAYLRREIPDINDKGVRMAMSSMPAVDLWIRTYFREKTVRILADGGIPVHLFGKDWEQMDVKHPKNLICSGRMVSSEECMQAMAQAQIALNTMPWFKDGAHDRVFSAMLQGAAALTDTSRYLQEQFYGDDTIIYYDLRKLEELPELVHKMQKRLEWLYSIACRGKAAAEKMHTWEQRAEVLQAYVLSE